jgi:3D (Asp-Asp-Asp) domain-containing protein
MIKSLFYRVVFLICLVVFIFILDKNNYFTEKIIKHSNILTGVIVTAYCPCKICNLKKWENKSATGPSLTYWIKKLEKENIIGCAVDKTVIPLYSKIIYKGQLYQAIDTGVKGKHIDILFKTHKETNKFGIYYDQEIEILY